MKPISRRSFLKASAAFGAFTFLPARIALGKKKSGKNPPSEKVNLALIGIGNQANGCRELFVASDLCNIVALCDVDLHGKHTREAREAHPDVPQFTDFRQMFDKMGGQIDAVLVATPDHSHFAAAMLAMALGKHVFVEKPLAHTFGQCARLMALSLRSGVATQMGNQGYSGANYFQFKAWREAGLIKNVRKITANMNSSRRWHGWKDVAGFPQEPMPDGLDWEAWLSTAATQAPYSKQLHPLNWRGWFEYGSGAFGDWGPHILDTCHSFLELGLPEKVTALHRDGANSFIFPQASTIRFDFPERGPDLPACEVTWYDGKGNTPTVDPQYADRLAGESVDFSRPGKLLYSDDLIFKGGTHARPLQILPREKSLAMREQLPQFPQRNSNHYTNFLRACKGTEQTRSPFSVSGPLTQMLCLGVLAQRLGGEIHFDRKTQSVTNNPVAQALLDPAPRKGWEEFYRL